MRRAVLAVFLCAAPLLAATAQASTGMVERVALREALRQHAHASGNGVVRLPLPEAPRVSAAAARRGLARLASSPGPEHLLVGVRSHGDVDGVAAKLRALGAEPERFDTIAVLAARVPSAADAIAALRDDARVAYVERDEPLRVAVEPFDISDFETGRKFSWAYDAVRAGEALAAVGGGSARTVSVIDTGLDVTHPEFAGQVQQAFDTEARNTNVTDIVGHGTFVTGLIAALDGNSRGGKGVAGTTKVLAVRASRDTDGSFRLSDLITGIEFSIRRGADVLNMSLAGPNFTRSQARALEAAFFNDVLPVAASGNNAENGNPLEFPAAAIGGRRGGRGVGLSVAATDPNGGHAPFSTHNAFVSLAGPGAGTGGCDGVFSTIPSTTNPPWAANDCPRTFMEPDGRRYAYGEGTSFAAPIVSGLAALAWQAKRRLASEQVADVLVRAANGGGWNEFTGAGVVDGMHAVEIARIYDVLGPRARARTRRRGNRVRVTVRRSRDRTLAGDELAGAVTYGLLVSRDGGRSYRVIASRRPRPFSRRIAIRGSRPNLLVTTACDGNGNCGVRRLGRFLRFR
ncbi:MAG TPA: S8 family serine peptidase [Thermoleophilaceae bacterium]|nr:S8 family serine peptidase [Thermoleophilaceae bacterium]